MYMYLYNLFRSLDCMLKTRWMVAAWAMKQAQYAYVLSSFQGSTLLGRPALLFRPLPSWRSSGRIRRFVFWRFLTTFRPPKFLRWSPIPPMNTWPGMLGHVLSSVMVDGLRLNASGRGPDFR